MGEWCRCADDFGFDKSYVRLTPKGAMWVGYNLERSLWGVAVSGPHFRWRIGYPTKEAAMLAAEILYA